MFYRYINRLSNLVTVAPPRFVIQSALRRWMVSVALTMALSTASHAAVFVEVLFTIADPLAVGQTHVLSMNDSNQVVGWYGNGFNEFGFLDSGGSYTKISFPGATNTWATGVNNSGQIVGVYSDGTGNHAFIYTGGTYTTLNLPHPVNPPSSSGGISINNNQQVLANYFDASGSHGYVYNIATNAVAQTISVPGAVGTSSSGGTTVTGFNDNGDIVGFYVAPPIDPSCGQCVNQQLGFVLHNGTFTNITASGAQVVPESINDLEQIVGESTACGSLCGGPIFTAFLSNNFGTGQDIIVLPGNEDEQLAFAVNNLGDILGVDGPGVFCCGPAAATPLPATLPLFASALTAMGLFGWRRKRKARAAA